MNLSIGGRDLSGNVKRLGESFATLFVSLAGSILSGFSAARLGYPLHFVLCALVAFAAAIVVAWRLTARDAAPRLDPVVAGASS